MILPGVYIDVRPEALIVGFSQVNQKNGIDPEPVQISQLEESFGFDM